jgi:hypothetical protein
VEVAIIASVAGLVGAIIGAASSYLVARQAWRRAIGDNALDDIARLHEVVWGTAQGAEASVILDRVKFRLEALEVPPELVEPLLAQARACQAEIVRQNSAPPFTVLDEIGVAHHDPDDLDRFGAARNAVVAHLRK